MVNESIYKIIDILENTELPYYKGSLTDPKGIKFCAEGVLLQETLKYKKIPRWFKESASFTTCDFDISEKALNTMNKKFGLDITNIVWDNPLDIRIDENIDDIDTEIYGLSSLLTILNDNYSDNHLQTARYLRKLCKKYDLENGVELK